jgi:hypothetical protein
VAWQGSGDVESQLSMPIHSGYGFLPNSLWKASEESVMVRHIVLIDTDQPSRVDAILRAQVPPMVGTVPGLKSVEIGYEDVSGLNLARGYDRVVLFTFNGLDDLKVWDTHPAHVAVRDALSGITTMLVYDYVA